MQTIVQDLRFALRQLRNEPGFTLTVVLTFALGIGATTAIFSLVEGILLRPLPFKYPDRLVLLGDHLGGRPNISVTAREIGTYTTETSSFSSLGGYITAGYELSGGVIPQGIRVARLTAGVFPTLGANPILGRIFTQEEENAHQPVAVISYAFWLEHYHRDPHVLGNFIVLDRKAYTIVGVMPREFEFPLQPGRLNRSELWVPLSLTADELSDQWAALWGYQMVARLKDGVALTQAAQDADRVSKHIMRDFPPRMASIAIQGDIRLLRDFAVADARPLLRTLLFAVSVVLLIACVNVTGLMLVRAIRRRREHAVRLALGAGSGAIICELVFEGLLLGVAGGLIGFGFAVMLVRTALRLLPESMPRVDYIAIDANVAGFAILVAMITGALCSLAPAFAALRTNLTESLKEGVRTAGGASHAWLRSALVVSEIAVALVLLTVSGAFLRSFQKMRAVDPGFRPDHVVVASFRLPLNQYPTEDATDSLYHAVVDRLTGKPGVVAAGITSAIPASGIFPGAEFTIEGLPLDKWKMKFARFTTTYGDYFHALGIPLIEGRYFTENDNAKSEPVVIVNQSMARYCWPGQEAIGKRFHVGNPNSGLPWLTVVGVVANVTVGSRDEPSEDEWYTPQEQPASMGIASPDGKLTSPATGHIAIRAVLPPEQMTQTLRASVAEIDPLLALREVRPMTEAISNIEAPRRFNTDLITTFALGALLLALVGIYAVVSFSVSLRRHEIAIRMALGSQRNGIARLILISGTRMALIGCGLGVIGSLAVSRLIRSLLFQVSPVDPLIYSLGICVMMLMALLGSALPAVRAASADPIEALRSV